MLRFEWEKEKRHWLPVLAVTAVLLVYYISAAFGSVEPFGGWSPKFFWENPDYQAHLRSRPTELADAAWVQRMEAEYRALVDAHCLTQEAAQAQLDAFWAAAGDAGTDCPYSVQEALDNRYDIDSAFVVLPDEIYHSWALEDFHYAFHIVVPLSQNAAETVQRLLERNAAYESYTERQRADRAATVQRVFAAFQPTVGYAYGWDMLISVGQRLPYTLGLALLVALCTVFSQERAAGMDPILRTTRHGRRRLVRVKLFRAWTVCTALWLLFQGVMLAAVALTYGLDGAACTVVNWSGMPSIYGLSYLQYYLLQSALSYCGALLQGLLVCLLSCLLPLRLNLPAGLLITLVTGFPNLRASYTDACFSLWQKLTALTPGQILGSFPTLQAYQSYDLGFCLVQLPWAVALAILLEAVLMTRLIHRLAGGR